MQAAQFYIKLARQRPRDQVCLLISLFTLSCTPQACDVYIIFVRQRQTESAFSSHYLPCPAHHRHVMANDAPADIKPWCTGTPLKVTTPFPDGKMVRVDCGLLAYVDADFALFTTL